MNESDLVLLSIAGYVVDCEYPLEITDAEDPSSRATGSCADLIMRLLREENETDPD